jgi:hypothetical protein
MSTDRSDQVLPDKASIAMIVQSSSDAKRRGWSRVFRATQLRPPQSRRQVSSGRFAPALLVLLSLLAATSTAGEPVTGMKRAAIGVPLVVTQLPVGTPAESRAPHAPGMLRADYGAGARLVRLAPDGSLSVLSRGFESACEPDVSYDGTRVLFAGRRAPSDPWNVFELTLATGEVRQVTRDLGDCRAPIYQSTLFTITEAEPWLQIGFVSTRAGWRNEVGGGPSSHLYTCKLDGSSVRRITYNLSSDYDPAITPDGRLVYATWRRATLDNGPLGRIALEGINVDGSDRAPFAPDCGHRIQHMPCVTPAGLVVFVTADVVPWDGAGSLASVDSCRPLHTYKAITGPKGGLFHSPAPLPDGRVIVSRRPVEGPGSHGLYVLYVTGNRLDPVFDDPRFHEIQARAVVARSLPDGRSSVVSEQDARAELYCLNVYTTDFKDRSWLPRGSVKAVRVVEGVPSQGGDTVAGTGGVSPLSARSVLAEVPVKGDGSFHLTVPANTPVQLQILDDRGLALRSCGWIWARSHQAQGCIGCHEDPERTPDNRVPEALYEPGTLVDVKADRKVAVAFRREIAPLVSARCVPCHGPGGSEPRLSDAATAVPETARNVYETLMAADSGPGAGKYVHPGQARTSPLVWHVLGRNTSRPWDGTAASRPVRPIPHGEGKSSALTEPEVQALIRWIDLGAAWDARATGPSTTGTR